LKKALSLQQGQLGPKLQVEGVAPTNHSSCRKTVMNELSCGVRMRAHISFILSQCTRLTDALRQSRITSEWLKIEL